MKNLMYTIFLASCIASAQNTLTFNESTTSPPASLDQMAWLAGHWKGEAFGGQVEEFWGPPSGNSMMFVFRMVKDGKVGFYEIGHIRQTGETLILQLKHFHADLSGWEEKDETVDFKLVKIQEDKAYFDNFTIEKVNDNEINMYVVIGDEDGRDEEVKFNYKKQF